GTRRRVEAGGASLGECPLLGFVVRVRTLETWIVLVRALIRCEQPPPRGVAFARLGLHRRYASIGRIDQNRRPLPSVHGVVVRSGIEPEVVVTANVAVGTGTAVAARGWRGSIPADRRVAVRVLCRDAVLESLRLFVPAAARR